MVDFSAYSVLSFDCYGTLIDWESGIVTALRPILEAHGIQQTDEQILELFGEFETQAQRPPYQSYRNVLATVVDRIGERLGFSPTADERVAFASSVPDWPAFPDSAESLKRLAKFYDLAILSNVDDDLFAGSARRLGVEFAEVVTAEQVGGYKPDPENFERLIERLDRPESEILHVAQSLFHDIAPANSAGLTTVWINRRHDRSGFGATPPQSAQPNLEVPDLATLAGLVEDARR